MFYVEQFDESHMCASIPERLITVPVRCFNLRQLLSKLTRNRKYWQDFSVQLQHIEGGLGNRHLVSSLSQYPGHIFNRPKILKSLRLPSLILLCP